MKYTKVIMAIAAAAVLMTGCGSTAETDTESKETTSTTAAAASSAETEATTASAAETPETETTESEEDPFGAEFWEANERLLPVTYEGNFEYKGVTFKTMSDVFAASGDEPYVGSSANQFICVIENDDICARFIANMPAELMHQMYELDVFDDDYTKKQVELVKDLDIVRVDDLKDGIPAQDDLDKYIGVTVSEFEAAGFEMSGWSIVETEGEFNYSNGVYEFAVVFNEPLTEGTDYYEEGSTDGFTIKSVKYTQLSTNVFNTDDLFE